MVSEVSPYVVLRSYAELDLHYSRLCRALDSYLQQRTEVNAPITIVDGRVGALVHIEGYKLLVGINGAETPEGIRCSSIDVVLHVSARELMIHPANPGKRNRVDAFCDEFKEFLEGHCKSESERN